MATTQIVTTLNAALDVNHDWLVRFVRIVISVRTISQSIAAGLLASEDANIR